MSHRSVTTVTTHLITNDYNAIVDCADVIKMKDTWELHLLFLQMCKKIRKIIYFWTPSFLGNPIISSFSFFGYTRDIFYIRSEHE